VVHDAEFIRTSIEALNRAFEKSLHKKVQQTGFTLPQMRVIEAVVAQPGTGITDLAHTLQMTQSTVSGIVERLIAKDILDKRPSPRDKRFVQVYPAENVTRFMETTRAVYVNEAVETALRQLQPDQRAMLVHGLRLLLSAVDASQKTTEQQT
jgi:DNA-binding MarR family transcriptional regulator